MIPYPILNSSGQPETGETTLVSPFHLKGVYYMNNRKLRTQVKNLFLILITTFCVVVLLMCAKLDIPVTSPFFDTYVLIILTCCGWLGLFALANGRG